MEGHNESMLQVNSGKVDSEKAGFNRFHVKLTSKSEKKMAYEFRTLKCEEDKDLAPGILKPGEVVTVVKYLAKDVDQARYHVLYREVDNKEKDAKKAVQNEGYYEGELVVFKV